MFRKKKTEPQPVQPREAEPQVEVSVRKPDPVTTVKFGELRLTRYESEALERHGWFLSTMGAYVKADDLRKIADELDRQDNNEEDQRIAEEGFETGTLIDNMRDRNG
jgi:hypothetical protein